MQSQTTYTRAKTLGPFLTPDSVVVAGAGQRIRAKPFGRRRPRVPTSDHVPFAAREEAFREAEPAPRPLKLGPMLTLILTPERRQPEGLPELAVRVCAKRLN